jgi:hypothetical protein
MAGLKESDNFLHHFFINAFCAICRNNEYSYFIKIFFLKDIFSHRKFNIDPSSKKL